MPTYCHVAKLDSRGRYLRRVSPDFVGHAPWCREALMFLEAVFRLHGRRNLYRVFPS